MKVDYDEKEIEITKVYVVREEWEGNEDRDIYTISPYPDQLGWETDSGCDGYGLPKAIADAYAQAINEYIEKNGSIKHIPVPSKFR